MSVAAIFAVVASIGFVAAMFQNWVQARMMEEAQRNSFRSGYYHGFLDARLGRPNDWRIAAREEEDREHAAQ